MLFPNSDYLWCSLISIRASPRNAGSRTPFGSKRGSQRNAKEALRLRWRVLADNPSWGRFPILRSEFLRVDTFCDRPVHYTHNPITGTRSGMRHLLIDTRYIRHLFHLMPRLWHGWWAVRSLASASWQIRHSLHLPCVGFTLPITLCFLPPTIRGKHTCVIRL